jgi:protein-tyrosine-phosphatase
MKSILFVCSGNIFRSMCAELFLKKHLQEKNIKIKVTSAGITAKKQEIHLIVKKELDRLNIDYSKHKQRKVTKKILDSSSLVISMAKVHQQFLKKKFNKDSILFNEIVFEKKEDFLDYPDILKETNSEKKAENYLRKAVKEIDKGTKKMLLSKSLQQLYKHN